MAKYRIVRDNYNGYEVQVRRWWLPFWVMAGVSNTHTSAERAECWAEGHAKKEIKRLGKWVND